ncbi:hypothetical protein R0G64_31925, partial [Pseudomonas otitidis]|nr:hypothetical protein [Pseudomonas otitidis]
MVVAYGLWYSTSLISYEWRWNRVPQYFAYQAEEAQRAREHGYPQGGPEAPEQWAGRPMAGHADHVTFGEV